MKKISAFIFAVIIALAVFVVPARSSAQTTTTSTLQDSLAQLRKDRQAFKDALSQEKVEMQKERAEKSQTLKTQIEQKRAEFQKKREENRKTVLLRLIDIQIRHLTNTKERVGKMPNIQDSLKTQLNTKIDEVIQKLNDERIKVQNATTPEALKALAVEIKDYFKSYRDVVKQIVDAIHASRATATIEKATERLTAIQSKLDELKAAGKDVTALQAELDQAKAKIEDAKTQTTNNQLTQAAQDLKAAYDLFQDIAQKAKSL